jgi:V8-like Glu-specific endopeptidase
MRFRDKNEPLHHPILKPANLPDFLTVARTSWADQVVFVRANNQGGLAMPPPNGLQVRVGFCSNNYRLGQDAWDVAVCRLHAPIAGNLHFFQPTATNANIVGEEIHLTGYPGIRGGEMWEDLDEVNGVEMTTNTMIYTHDTWGGNSGSPTWIYDSIGDIVTQHAIHVSRQPQELRRGVLITQAVLEWINTARQRPTPIGAGYQLVDI